MYPALVLCFGGFAVAPASERKCVNHENFRDHRPGKLAWKSGEMGDLQKEHPAIHRPLGPGEKRYPGRPIRQHDLTGSAQALLPQPGAEENTCHLIQYLLTFAEKVPGDPPPSKDPAAPEEQLHEFVRYQVDLLLEKDVKKAILREYSQLGILKSGNFWYYEGRITDLHKELDAAMNSCPRQGPAAINQLCRVLERLSLFWFDLCREDVRRVRTSDILIYKLTLILRNSGVGLGSKGHDKNRRPLPPGLPAGSGTDHLPGNEGQSAWPSLACPPAAQSSAGKNRRPSNIRSCSPRSAAPGAGAAG